MSTQHWVGRQFIQFRSVCRRVAKTCGNDVSGRFAVVYSLLIGTVPLLLGYALGTSLHQPLFGLMLSPLLIGCLYRGKFLLALVAITLAIASHSLLAIYLSHLDASRMGVILDGSGPYWERTRHWILTGDDPEYDWRHFVPAHLTLGLLVIFGGYFTWMCLPLMVGIRELDLMNFYVGRLIAEGSDSWTALFLGWHPWSIIRGLSYSFLLLSTSAWSIAWITGDKIDKPRLIKIFFGSGLLLAILDAVVKLMISPLIRERLYAVLVG